MFQGGSKLHLKVIGEYLVPRLHTTARVSKSATCNKTTLFNNGDKVLLKTKFIFSALFDAVGW